MNILKAIALFILLITFSFSNKLIAQSDDSEAVRKTCLNYIEGFYEGDSTKLIAALKPDMYKIGYWKNKDSGKYGFAGQMTFTKAKAYAAGVLEKERFTPADAIKIVEVLDVTDQIAAAKVTATWGIDYILLSKQEDGWKIEQVLWKGPLGKKKKS